MWMQVKIYMAGLETTGTNRVRCDSICPIDVVFMLYVWHQTHQAWNRVDVTTLKCTDSTLILWSLLFLAIIYIYYSQYMDGYLMHFLYARIQDKCGSIYIHINWWSAGCWKVHGWNLQSLMDTTHDSPEDSDGTSHRKCIFRLNHTYLSNSPKGHTTACDTLTCSNSPSFCPGL